MSIQIQGAQQIAKKMQLKTSKSSCVAQHVKDPALSQQWLESLLWCGFDPWPGNVCMLQVQTKPNKQTKKQPKQNKTCKENVQTEIDYNQVVKSQIAEKVLEAAREK